MSKTEALPVELRACYEHFKSRADKRKTYTTLGFSAVEGSVDVLYIADYDPDRIYRRPIDEFTEMTMVGDRHVPRFTLRETDVISVEERDLVLDELDEDSE